MAGLTLAALRTRVQALGYGTDVASTIDLALNATQNRVCAIRRWDFLLTSQSVTSTVGASVITLSALASPLTRPDGVWGVDGTDEFYLTYLEPAEFWKRRADYYDNETGLPLYWTYFESDVYYFPLADKATYTLTVDGMKPVPTLSNDSDQTIVPVEYGEVLVWGAAAWLAVRERDWAARQVFEEMFAKHLNAMLTAYTHEQRQNAGEVGRWKGWNEVGGGRMLWQG